MTKPVCSIIIRSHNEEKYLGRLLEGILKQTIIDVETILVDSGSTDNTLKIASQYPVKVVNIAPHDFTFGRSLNFGIQHAAADILVFASAHVFPVYPDWLENLLAPFSDPQIALVYGKQRGAERTKFSEHQIFASWYPDVAQPYQDTAFCNNANAAVRRELAVKFPYNETLPGLEDLDWAHRMMEKGFKVHYAPEAEIIHVHDETPQGVYNRYKREAIAFKHIFIHERFGLMDFLRLSLRNIAKDIKFAWQQRVLGKSFISIIWFRVCQFWGTYQGYRHHGPLTWELRKRFYYPEGVAQPGGKAPREIDPIEYRSSN